MGNGEARCQLIYRPSQVGSAAHGVTAIYAGDPAHEPSRNSDLVGVTPPNGGHPTTTTLDCQPAKVAVGKASTCTATVTDTDPGNPAPPTRAVVFASDSPGAFSLGGCRLERPAGDKASCKFTYIPSEVGSGTHTISAAYEGDPAHEPSPLNSDQVTVTAPAGVPNPVTVPGPGPGTTPAPNPNRAAPPQVAHRRSQHDPAQKAA